MAATETPETFSGKTAGQINQLLHPQKAALTQALATTKKTTLSAVDYAEKLPKSQSEAYRVTAQKLDQPHKDATSAVKEALEQTTEELKRQEAALTAIRNDIETLESKIANDSTDPTTIAALEARKKALENLAPLSATAYQDELTKMSNELAQIKADWDAERKTQKPSADKLIQFRKDYSALQTKINIFKKENPLADNISKLEAQKSALEAQETNLENNRNPALDVGKEAWVKANAIAAEAVKVTSEVAAHHPISPISSVDAKIDTKALEKALEDYKNDPSITEQLQSLQTYTTKANEQLAAVKAIEAKMVDQRTFDTYKDQYKAALDALDETLGNIAKTTNINETTLSTKASSTLQDVANRVDDFDKYFNNLRNLDKEVNDRKRALEQKEALLGIAGGFKKALAVVKAKVGTYRTEEDRPTIPSLSQDKTASAVDFSKEFGISTKNLVDGKLVTSIPRDKFDNPVKPTLAELNNAVRAFNERHKNASPPVQLKLKKNLFGNGYTIDCKNPAYKKEMIDRLTKLQEDRLEKAKAAAVTEGSDATAKAMVAEDADKKPKGPPSADGIGPRNENNEVIPGSEAPSTIANPGHTTP